MVGTLDIGRYRLSDFFCDPTADVVPLDDAWIGDLERPDARPNRLAPANFRKHSVILAAALDTLTPEGPARSRYVPTTPIPVAASTGPFYVQGNIHVNPGEHFDVRRLFGPESRPFVPLTGASIIYTPNPHLDARYKTLLVRTDKVEFAGLTDSGVPIALPFLARAVEDRLRQLIGGRRRSEES